MVCGRNRWTSPQLDGIAQEIREDAALKRVVSALKLKFLGEVQALLHGGLHTGSIMVTADDVKVIDPEFAVVGPMGFDVGELLGNLLMSFFSQRGHEGAPGERDAYRRWILETVEAVWTRFNRRFVELWAAYPSGDGYPAPLFDGPEGRASLRAAQMDYMRRLFEDALGFAGAPMIRRTLGLAHNIDMEWIEDPDRRSPCERRNLQLARELVTRAAGFADSGAVTGRAAALEAGWTAAIAMARPLGGLLALAGVPDWVLKQSISCSISRGEPLKPMPAAIDQATGAGEVAFEQRLLDRPLPIGDEGRQHPPCRARLDRAVRLAHQPVSLA
jgi:5-methylthioribose kinase